MSEPERRPSAFVTTRWTRVLQAKGGSDEAAMALGELCEAYYRPVSAFIRGWCRDEETARDLTQEFFAGLLARRGLGAVEPGRGRFRSFLLGAVKHFLANRHDREQAAKRGGGRQHVPLDASLGSTTAGLQIPDANAPAPDVLFDRQWALTLLDRALGSLAREYAAEPGEAGGAGKALFFETLKPWLTGDVPGLSQAEAAARLGLNEGAIKVAIHRLRKRFRETIKAEIAQTLAEPGLVEDELLCLRQALRS